MKRPYQITGIVLTLFGAFMASESLSLRFYTPEGPGPGLYPLFVSILIAFLGAVMLFQATFRVSDPMPTDFFPDKAGALRVGALVLALVVLLFLMVPLGFILTAMAFLAFVLLAMGRQKPLAVVLVAVAGSYGIYYVFAHWLAVPLPTGVFGF